MGDVVSWGLISKTNKDIGSPNDAASMTTTLFAGQQSVFNQVQTNTHAQIYGAADSASGTAKNLTNFKSQAALWALPSGTNIPVAITDPGAGAGYGAWTEIGSVDFDAAICGLHLEANSVVGPFILELGLKTGSAHMMYLKRYGRSGGDVGHLQGLFVDMPIMPTLKLGSNNALIARCQYTGINAARAPTLSVDIGSDY